MSIIYIVPYYESFSINRTCQRGIFTWAKTVYFSVCNKVSKNKFICFYVPTTLVLHVKVSLIRSIRYVSHDNNSCGYIDFKLPLLNQKVIAVSFRTLHWYVNRTYFCWHTECWMLFLPYLKWCAFMLFIFTCLNININWHKSPVRESHLTFCYCDIVSYFQCLHSRTTANSKPSLK